VEVVLRRSYVGIDEFVLFDGLIEWQWPTRMLADLTAESCHDRHQWYKDD